MSDPLWYKDAIIYEVHVRAFADSNADGIGDFRGMTEKLDYLQDLGVTAIWLLPFYPSPLKDDGYDIADFLNVNPSYGTLADVRRFVREAHRRGLRVITELVCNHTSDQHPWFQRARHAPPGSAAREFYVWSDTPEKYQEARIIFKDFEASNWTWDPVANAYYWHRFYSHQPDLNFDNPRVHQAIFRALDFWMEMGVDGLRLDAIPYLYEREGTNCENLPETYEFLKLLRRHVDERFQDRMLLAEANQWPEDAVAYLGDGDACHMAFHFPLMPRMFMAIRMEDRFPIIDILAQTPAIPDTAQWALFLRNHDELTLEMVTDEERDYMYRVYAHDPQTRINLGIRRRLAPLLGNNRRRIELMKGLLFSLPGTPVLYYGDELGMGDNPYLGDRNGVRTPMQWSADRNAGFSDANPQRLYLPAIIDPEYHYQTVNVEAQQSNQGSLLWWTKRLIALRKRYRAFSRGTIEFLHPENRKVLAFIRRYEDETILVVANLSRFVQAAELDLSAQRSMVPVELFGHTRFPPIGELPYFITLGPHTFYWFVLEPQRVIGDRVMAGSGERGAGSGDLAGALPALTVAGAWDRLLIGDGRAALDRILPGYLQNRRWFGGKARQVRSARVREAVPLRARFLTAYLALIAVEYTEGDPEVYALPLTVARAERAAQVLRDAPQAIVACLRFADGSDGVLYDAFIERDFAEVLLAAVANRRRLKGDAGDLIGSTSRGFRSRRAGTDRALLDPTVVRAEQSNTSVIYGDRYILKLFRRLQEGENPDLEVGRFLTHRGFSHTPAVLGALEYRPEATSIPQSAIGNPQSSLTLAILQQFVPNEGDAWEYTQDILGDYFERALISRSTPPWEAIGNSQIPRVPGRQQATEPPPIPHSAFRLPHSEVPSQVYETIGAYVESARLLGQRTAEMHLALASSPHDPDFAPEPSSMLYQRSLYQSMRSHATQTLQLLRRNLGSLSEGAQEEARTVLDAEDEILRRLQAVVGLRNAGVRIRTHGDYHLGQVLFTGNDFIIIDFEGEPARPLSERRIRRSALRDVAGMIRSFHYAAYSALIDEGSGGLVRHIDLAALEPWAEFWHSWVSAVFLQAYLDTAGDAAFLPAAPEELRTLLDVYLLEKAIYELGYELNNRPGWVRIPLQGIRRGLGAGG